MTAAWQAKLSGEREETPAPVERRRSSPVTGSSHVERYVRGTLDSACSTVAGAAEGERNDTLNREVFAVAGLVHTGFVTEDEIASAFADAARWGSPRCKAGDTRKIAAAIKAGMAEPREIPERTLPQQKNGNDCPSFSTATLPPDDFGPVEYGELGEQGSNATLNDDAEPGAGNSSDNVKAVSEPPPDDGFEHGDEDAPDAEPVNRVDDVNSNSGAEPEPSQPSSTLLRLGTLLEPALARVEARRNGEERPVPLLFSQHAEILGGGLFAGGHTFIAGTGTGKSQYWFQTSLHAAKQGVPVLYVGLELNEFAVSVRLMGEESGIGWSKLYTGRCSEEHIRKARDTFATLGGLPFYCDFGDATGWPPSRLVQQIALIRKEHPTGPILVVLDFLQLVGEDFDPSGRHRDLRERIGRAAYAGTFAANKYGAAVVLVSSTARGNYGMGGIMESAGLVSRPLPGHVEPVRTILNPEPLLGIGKESGEIEYSAESQSVLIRWPALLENGESAVILAVPKLRYGARGWFAMSFWSRFSSLPIKSTDELPEITKGGAPVVTEDELTERILETVRKNPKFTSKDSVATKTKGKRTDVLKRIGALAKDGIIEIGKDGCRVCE